MTESSKLDSWLITVDNRRIAILYLSSTGAAFAIGGVCAVLMRAALWSSGETGRIIGSDSYNRLFSIHGASMMFLFAIPAIPGVFGNLLVPKAVGAENVAFPRLNRLGLTVYWWAMLWLLWSLSCTTSQAGYSTAGRGSISLLLLAISGAMSGLNFLVTIFRRPAPAIPWPEMPVFVWTIAAASVIQVVSVVPSLIAACLIAYERVVGIGIFDPSLGGDPVLFQHFSTAARAGVQLAILPAAGLLCDLVTANSSHGPVSYWTFAKWSAVLSLCALAVLALGWCGIHLDWAVALLKFIGGLCTCVWLWKTWAVIAKWARPFTPSMAWTAVGVWNVTVGIVTSFMLLLLSGESHIADTYFVVANLHYLFAGGTGAVFFAALYHWLPELRGRRVSRNGGILAAAISFTGCNMAFGTMFVLGSRGMPRRYYNYLDQFQTLHRISTVGTYVLAVGVALAIWSLVRSARNGAADDAAIAETPSIKVGTR